MLNGTSAVRHGTIALFNAGVKKMVVVTGHAEDSIKNALEDLVFSSDIHFVKNDMYNFHGCNYSVACGMAAIIKESKKVIIAEGDSLIHPTSIEQLVSCNEESAVLVRSPEYIDPKRSVVAIGTSHKVTRYAYDQNHIGNFPVLTERERIIGESMQLWSFSGEVLNELCDLLKEYKETAEKSKVPKSESGVYSINKLQTPAMPVMSNLPKEWININTKHDLEKAKVLKWIQK